MSVMELSRYLSGRPLAGKGTRVLQEHKGRMRKRYLSLSRNDGQLRPRVALIKLKSTLTSVMNLIANRAAAIFTGKGIYGRCERVGIGDAREHYLFETLATPARADRLSSPTRMGHDPDTHVARDRFSYLTYPHKPRVPI